MVVGREREREREFIKLDNHRLEKNETKNLHQVQAKLYTFANIKKYKEQDNV